MKTLGKAFTVFVFELMNTVAWGQTTYKWNVASGDYQVSTNWDPTRTIPLATDILAFDGSVQATPMVTNLNTETVAQVILSNSATVVLSASTITKVLTITGGAGNDLDVGAGSTLSVSGSIACTLSVATAATGSVSGAIAMAGAAHRLIAVDASAVTFQSGGSFTSGTSFSGNPFGTGTTGSVIFANGSSFIFTAGSDPFGTSGGVGTFQSGSTYYHQATTAPSFSGRTYANFVLNFATASISSTDGLALTIENLTITDGTLNLNLTGTINIKGNIIVGPAEVLTFTPASNGGVTIFNGTSAQSISGGGTITFATNANVRLDNSNGLTFSSNATVSDTLEFTSGKITLDAGVALTMGSALSIVGASSTSYIVADASQGSTLRRNGVGASDVFFPIGLSSSYNPVTINNAGTAADYSVGVQSGFDVAPPNESACVNRQWNITEASGGPSNSTLTFQWSTADQNGSFNPASSGVIGRYSTQWDEVSAPITDVGGGIYTANASGFSSFSSFGVGNTGSLPVQLASFSAVSNRLGAELRWSTTTELNNYGFEAERRNVGLGSWSKIGFVAGAGTSTSPRDYSYVDANLPAGRYAYRIKQIDNDGTFQYYGNAEVEIGAVAKEFKLESNYPNPFNPTTTIEFTVETNGRASLRVFNMLGQEVATLFDGVAEAGRLQQVKFDASQLPSGLYFAKLQASSANGAGKQQMIKKMLLMK